MSAEAVTASVPEIAPAAAQTRKLPPGMGWLLAVCCVAQFMVILDLSIVNVALPSIQSALNSPRRNCSGWSTPTRSPSLAS